MTDIPSPRHTRTPAPKAEPMPPNPDHPPNIAVQLAEMRGDLNEKLARIVGKQETIQAEQQAEKKAATNATPT